MGREEGGGFRMGNTCMPVADSFRYMAEPIQYCKVFFKKKNKAVSPDTGSGHSGGRPGFNSLNLITGASQPSGAMTQELLTCVAPRFCFKQISCNELGQGKFFTDA